MNSLPEVSKKSRGGSRLQLERAGQIMNPWGTALEHLGPTNRCPPAGHACRALEMVLKRTVFGESVAQDRGATRDRLPASRRGHGDAAARVTDHDVRINGEGALHRLLCRGA
jgi:hypothetical protein